jgi:MFS family permease
MTVLGVTIGHLGDRWRKPRAIGLCLTIFLASTVSLLLVREIAVLMLVAFFFGGSGVTGTLVSSFIGSIAPENRRGLWLSVPQTLSLVAAFAAPYLAGFLYTLDPNNTLMFSIVATPFLILFALVGLKE